MLQYVVSHNLHRRHLTDSQRAMIAARLATRQPGVRGQLTDISKLPPSQSEAADLLGVKRDSITKARRVIRSGSESLQALANDGQVPVTTAARVATELAPDEQEAYVEQVRAGADPVKAAPPDLKQQEADRRRKGGSSDRPPAPPKFGGNRRKHLDQIEAVIVGRTIELCERHGHDTSELEQRLTELRSTPA